jgi:hypothetical protein
MQTRISSRCRLEFLYEVKFLVDAKVKFLGDVGLEFLVDEEVESLGDGGDEDHVGGVEGHDGDGELEDLDGDDVKLEDLDA